MDGVEQSLVCLNYCLSFPDDTSVCPPPEHSFSPLFHHSHPPIINTSHYYLTYFLLTLLSPLSHYYHPFYPSFPLLLTILLQLLLSSTTTLLSLSFYLLPTLPHYTPPPIPPLHPFSLSNPPHHQYYTPLPHFRFPYPFPPSFSPVSHSYHSSSTSYPFSLTILLHPPLLSSILPFPTLPSPILHTTTSLDFCRRCSGKVLLFPNAIPQPLLWSVEGQWSGRAGHLHAPSSCRWPGSLAASAQHPPEDRRANETGR